MKFIAQDITVKIATKVICQSASLHLRPGEVWGVLGPNGCGKTTLLHALAGLYPLNTGELFLDQTNYKQLSSKAIAQSVGLLFQDFVVNFPQTVWDYCLAGRYPHLTYLKKESERDKEIVTQALTLMGFEDAHQKNIHHLSGGEKRRLAIAALLAQTPKIYLLDEPTNHLDIKHQIKVLSHFKNLANSQAATVIMALHDINLAQQYCDHILLLFQGGWTKQGLKQDMLTSSQLTQLYQHPIQSISTASGRFWYPNSN
jgi:iron complex transport system ATP-binding protein